MSLKQLNDLEYIENKLLAIRDIVKPVDAYHISDAIIASINDELLPVHITEMMSSMGYEQKVIKKIIKIIKDIQNKT